MNRIVFKNRFCCLTKGKPMNKHIIFVLLIVVALLSFGMSDSKDKELNLPTIEQLEEERRLKEQAIKDSIVNYHKVELENFLSAI